MLGVLRFFGCFGLSMVAVCCGWLLMVLLDVVGRCLLFLVVVGCFSDWFSFLGCCWL